MFEAREGAMADVVVIAQAEALGRVLVGHPLVAVQGGFPSPAQDYEGRSIDLNDILIKDRTSTYVVRVTGDSMAGAGIAHGDEVIVDRSLTPHDGNVVIAIVDGELTIKRLRIRPDGTFLVPENRDYPVQRLAEHAELQIWGVVTRSLHHV